MSEYADKELIQAVNDLVYALDNVQIIINRFPSLGIDVSGVQILGGDHNVFLQNGIDEVAELMNRKVKDHADPFARRKTFDYSWTTFTQYPKKTEVIYARRKSPLGGTATINGKTQIYTEEEIEQARKDGTLG